MSKIRLLKAALRHQAEYVLDLGCGDGFASKAFIGTGSKVVGIDVKNSPQEHDDYTHVQMAFEMLEPQEEAEPFDLVWCTNVLQSVPNVQAFLVQMHSLMKEDCWLYLSVPALNQERMHIGGLTLWTPALLVYNLICAGYDCSDAQWYTEYDTIGLCMKVKRIEDMSWRSGCPLEEKTVNDYTPVQMRHESGAWWANNWPEKTQGRMADPPLVTTGVIRSNLPPQAQLAYGPNPELRKGYERKEWAESG